MSHRYCLLVTDAGLSAIARHCPVLAHLDMGYSSDIRTPNAHNGSTNLPTPYSRDCPQITDAGIMAVARKCPLLAYIKLSHCILITDDGVLAAAQECPLLAHSDLSPTSIDRWCTPAHEVNKVTRIIGTPADDTWVKCTPDLVIG